MSAQRFVVLSALALGRRGPGRAVVTFSGPNGRISFFRFVEETDSDEIFSAAPDGSDVSSSPPTPVVARSSPTGLPTASGSRSTATASTRTGARMSCRSTQCPGTVRPSGSHN